MLNTVQNTLERPLAAHIVVVLVLILHKVLVLLLNCVVRQVHIDVVDVLVTRLLVLFSGEPCQAILINVDSKRTDAHQQYVESEIILVPIDQVRLMQVLLNDDLVLGLHLFYVFPE